MKKYVLALCMLLPFYTYADVPSCGENCTYSYVQNGEDAHGNPTYTLKIEPIDPSKPASVKDNSATCTGGCHNDAPWSSNPSITKLDIAQGIISVGRHAFSYSPSIEEITLPEGLESIGDKAFHRTGITTIDLPSSLQEIGNTAFVTKTLTRVNGSLENLVTIGDRAFTDTALTDFIIPPSLTKVPDDIFHGKDSWDGYISHNISNLYCPESLAEQCAAAISYRGDEVALKTYNWTGGVYVLKDEQGNETFYLSSDNMRSGDLSATQEEKMQFSCNKSLNECKRDVLEAKGICQGSACDTFIQSDGNYMLKYNGKTYQSINDLLKGNYDKRRIYTIEEANFVAGPVNRVSIKYR